MEWFNNESSYSNEGSIHTEALRDDIAYCRLVRKTIRGKVNYYLQLVLKGTPPQKHDTCDGEVGLDIGISTIAPVSDKEVMIEEFCEGLDLLELEKTENF